MITQLTATIGTLLRHGKSWTQPVSMRSLIHFFSTSTSSFIFISILSFSLHFHSNAHLNLLSRFSQLSACTSLYTTPKREIQRKHKLNNLFVANNNECHSTSQLSTTFYSFHFCCIPLFDFSFFCLVRLAFCLATIFAAIKLWNILCCCFCLYISSPSISQSYYNCSVFAACYKFS